jgi:glycosyltransferase involved in cell wall biosynthesis
MRIRSQQEPTCQRDELARPRLTVVVPTYNRPKYLAECLASIAVQSLEGFRLIVLDNASSSDTLGVVAAFPGLKTEIARNERNIGPGGNIQRAMTFHEQSDYLVIFHDDDVMHPRMLELQYQLLERDREIQFVSTELEPFPGGETPPLRVWDAPVPAPEVYEGAGDLARAILGDARLCFGSTMYRSAALRGEAFDVDRYSIYSDRPFLLGLARHGKCALIRGPLVLYRQHPGQDTSTGDLSERNLVELMKAYRDALPERWSAEDRDLFFGHTARFLVEQYRLLPASKRHGAVPFVRSCVRGGVARVRDLRISGWATLARADGWGWLVDALLRVKRGLSLG